MSDLDMVLDALAMGRREDTRQLRGIAEREQNGIFVRQLTVDGVYNVMKQDGTVFCDSSLGAVTVNLPSAVGLGGRMYVICDKGNAGAANVTILPAGAETISGAASYVISSNYGSVWLQSDGSNWFVIAIF